MANSLGSLGGFEVDPNQDGPIGMKYAGTAELPAAPPSRAEPLLVGEGHGPELMRQFEEREASRPKPKILTQEEILELARDTELALSRLEKHGSKSPLPELGEQVKSQLLALTGEYVALERAEAKTILVTGWENIVSLREARKLYLRIGTCRPENFLSEARGVVETLKTKWISVLTRSASAEN